MALILTVQEQLSPLGQKLLEHASDRLAVLRLQNDHNYKLSEPERLFLCAEIKVLKDYHRAFDPKAAPQGTAATAAHATSAG